MDAAYYYLPKAFIKDPEYKVTPDDQLKDDLNHPEFNSYDYAHQVYSNYREPRDFLPNFCHLDQYQGSFIVGTNHFSSAVYDGNLIGSDKFESIVNQEINDTTFQINHKSTVTGLKILDRNLVSIPDVLEKFSF